MKNNYKKLRRLLTYAVFIFIASVVICLSLLVMISLIPGG